MGFNYGKRRVRLEINGVVCGLITQGSDEYMKSLAEEVGEMVTEIQIMSPDITREAAAMTAALSYCDDARKNGDARAKGCRTGWTSWKWKRRSGRKKRTRWHETVPDPQTRAHIEALERENTALQEVSQNVEALRTKLASLEDENAALRQETAKLSQLEILRREVERLQGENTRLHQAANASPENSKLLEELEKLVADNAALKLLTEEKEAQIQKAEQEKQATVAAAKRAVEEAKRLVDQAKAEAAAATASTESTASHKEPAEQLPAKEEEPEEAVPEKSLHKRKNPLRHEDESMNRKDL